MKMVRWPITRTWSVIGVEGNPEPLATSALAKFHACCLLGSAGLGKTFELTDLAAAERSGAAVRYHRLTAVAVAADGFAARLADISADVSDKSVIYLDALDEAMVPVPTAGLAVATWIREHLANRKPKLRISCRSAIWPEEVQTAIKDVYGADDTVVASLHPLTKEDVEAVASSYGINVAEFLGAIGKARVFTLATQPLTLEMLIRVYKSGGQLPKGRRELFHDSIRLLLRERKERREAGTVVDVPLDDLVDAAERLACYALLSGKEIINVGDVPTPDAINWLDLSFLTGAASINDETLRALAFSALFEGAGLERFRFAHRQLAEYLAGRRVAQLPLHQGRSLLACSSGWRSGVAGPLRETAAFAAMENLAIASWVADYDAEIIGLSEVADDALRRRALLALFECARRHELTDTQFSRGELELSGFQYASANADLTPVLRERGPGAEDVLESAIAVIESWKLQSMSNDLADLALDQTAPMHPRKSAAYALLNFGTNAARLRLRPLLEQSDLDPEFELKGITLRCLWPSHLTVPELLHALTPRRRTNYFGAYDGFLSELDRSGFSAEGYLAEGLEWARRHLPSDSDHHSNVRIAKRIAHRAVGALPDSAITEGLVQLLLDCGRAHLDSPLDRIRNFVPAEDDERTNPPPLQGKMEARRLLIDALLGREHDRHTLWWVANHTPGLLTLEDFPWLMQRSADSSRPMDRRQGYSDLSRTLAWYYDQPSVESWLVVRKVEPIASTYHIPLLIDLNGDAAAEGRKQHVEMKRLSKRPRRSRVKPAPPERVRQALELAELKDPRFFLNLCNELTLENYSSRYGFPRPLTGTPGWTTADHATRSRIIDAAKRLLSTPTDEPERARVAPLSSILPGYMPAILLLAELDFAWLASQPPEWWAHWAWYIVRELRTHMHGEADDLKTGLMAELHRRAPGPLRNAVIDIAKMTDQESRPLLDATLESLSGVPDAELDDRLGKLIEKGSISPDRLGAVAEFALARDSASAISVCLAKLERAEARSSEETAVQLALALLSQRTAESWDAVISFLQGRRDLAARVLAHFAHNERRAYRREGVQYWLEILSVGHVRQLLDLLIEIFPYESDAKHETMEMHQVAPDDSARELRNQLTSWLMNQSDAEAVLALKHIEQRFGERYPWLRRPRAVAERAYRLSQWNPIPLASIAAMLNANSKALLRSGWDVVEGIEAALGELAASIRQEGSDDLEDLWNLPKEGAPTPKAEERVSAKLCQRVREYFVKYAVTADREVQIFRRKTRTSMDGAPGSEVDVLARVPAVGSAEDEPIAVPVEVKLSSNTEGKTAMELQLTKRYMAQLGTDFGVFVVAWMGRPPSGKTYRPIWKDIESARAELTEQADQMKLRFGSNIAVVVFDASLPLKSSRGAKEPTVAKTKSGTKKSKISPRSRKGGPRSTKKTSPRISRRGRRV